MQSAPEAPAVVTTASPATPQAGTPDLIRVALYCASLDPMANQAVLARGRAYAAAQGWVVVSEFAETASPNRSPDRRPLLRQAIHELEEDRVTGLLVPDDSHLSASAVSQEYVRHWIESLRDCFVHEFDSEPEEVA